MRRTLENAEEILLKAVELDPNFAEAYELLAFTIGSKPDGLSQMPKEES